MERCERWKLEAGEGGGGLAEMGRLEAEGWQEDGGVRGDGKKGFLEDRGNDGSAGPGGVA